LQGAGAALMTPTTLAIIAVAFTDEKERARAVGVWAATAALAFAVGPITGGAIAEHINWSWIFWINVPVGIVGWLVGRSFLDESRDPSVNKSIDLPGLLVSGSALLALVYALIEGNAYGWSSPLIIGLLVATTVGFLTLVLLERRTADPMLDVSLFRNRTFSGANALLVMSGFGIFGVYFFLSLYMQEILGFTATKAGLAFVPMALLITAVAPASQKLADRISTATTVAVGMTISAIGFLLLSRVGEHAAFAAVLPGLIVIGFGAGLTTPLTAAVLGTVPVAQSGVASGVLNTMRELAATLGIAVTGTILTAREGAAIAQGASHSAGFVDGFHTGLYVSAGVMLGGAVIALLALRIRQERPRLMSAPEPA
jgi:EmrB/QacA subfamily drug resistance transporter